MGWYEESRAWYEEHTRQRDEKLERIRGILAEHGIRINLSGCGCCESPDFTFEYRGERIIESESGFFFTMIDDLLRDDDDEE